MNDISYDTVLRYGLNSFFTLAAGYFGLTSAQAATASSLTFTALSSAAAAAVWAWGIYRSKKSQKLADVAAIPGTTVVTTPALAAATPATNVISSVDNKVVTK